MAKLIIIIASVMLSSGCGGSEVGDNWINVKCDEQYQPENCDLNELPVVTVEDYERCAPAQLPINIRNYYLGWAGRGVTYADNQNAFRRIKIKPRTLQDISNNRLDISTLGQRVSFPVGIAPTAVHGFAHPDGENATARAAAAMNTIMIVSSYASMRLEAVAASVQGTGVNLWMQTYIFTDRRLTIDIVRRAERSGFKAIVLTVDSSVTPDILCDAKNDPAIRDFPLVNGNEGDTLLSTGIAAVTPREIKWLKSITRLPIVAKGILTGYDAINAIRAGASAIVVSTHGGRQLDGVPASIDALPEVVKAVNKIRPRTPVYLDSGIRNGFDVYKALASGAEMVFIGRPVLWGLTLGGEEGVKNVLSILKDEFNDTMLLAGASEPSKIRTDSVIRSFPDFIKQLLFDEPNDRNGFPENNYCSFPEKLP